MSEHIVHTIEPVFDSDSRVLILGTMPSPKSREVGFYYGHPRNRFWKVLALVLGESEPSSITEKIALLHRRHIALWDVLAACEIEGASDASIRQPKPNNLACIFSAAPIRAVFTTGAAAYRLYQKYQAPLTCLPPARLIAPSHWNNLLKRTEKFCSIWIDNRVQKRGEFHPLFLLNFFAYLAAALVTISTVSRAMRSSSLVGITQTSTLESSAEIFISPR